MAFPSLSVPRRAQADVTYVSTRLDIPGRFTALDGWRGVCALLVAVYHLHTTSHIEQLNFIRHSHLFVDFFFVLSGFVIAHAYGDRLGTMREAATMVWRRLGRLWPLHLAILSAFVALEFAIPVAAKLLAVERSAQFAFDPETAAQTRAIPTNILLLHGLGLHDRLTWNQPSWSISAEFWTYVLYGAIVIAARRWAVVVSLALLVLALGALAVLSDRYLAVDHDYGFLRCLAGFLVGSIVHAVVRQKRVQLGLPTVIEVAAVTAVVVFVTTAGRTPLEFAAPFVFAVVVWLFAQEQGKLSAVLKSPPFAMLGLISYSIYMVHSLVITLIHRSATVVEQVLGVQMTATVISDGIETRYIAFADQWAMNLFVVAYVLAVIAVARFTWSWIEMPGQRAWNNWRFVPRAGRSRVRSSEADGMRRAVQP